MKRLLFAYHDSESARRALRELPHLGFPGGLEVRVLSVADIWMPLGETLSAAGEEALSPSMRAARGRARDYISAHGERAARVVEELRQACPSWSIRAVVSAGPPAATILSHARQWGADLIVLGSHGRGVIGRFLRGDVARAVAGGSACPVRILGAAELARADSLGGEARVRHPSGRTPAGPGRSAR